MNRILVLVLMVTVLASCGGGGYEESSPVIPLVVPKPANVSASVSNGIVTIEWDSDFDSASFDIYLATKDNLQAENYSSFDRSEWIRNVSSPYEYTPEDLKYQYFFTVVAKTSGIESDQSDIVSAVPRYTDSGESVEDLYTNLIWLKCSIGQAYNSASNLCEGEPTRLSHNEVLSFIASNYPEWRMPTFSELVSLVYCETGNPVYFLENDEQLCDSDGENNATIYSSIFSNTLINATPLYRTSTPRIVPGFENMGFYESVDFLRGGRTSSTGNEPTALHAKLVFKFN
jgi:hypothetical protein